MASHTDEPQTDLETFANQVRAARAQRFPARSTYDPASDIIATFARSLRAVDIGDTNV